MDFIVAQLAAREALAADLLRRAAQKRLLLLPAAAAFLQQVNEGARGA